MPPIPHVSVKSEVQEPQKEIPAGKPKPGGKRKLVLAGAGLVALLMVGVGGYFGVQKYLAPPPPPPAPPAKAKTAPPAAPPKPTAATTPTPGAPAVTNAQPTPSDTLNKIAHTPANAINKAKDAVAARGASGQSDLNAAGVGDGLADKPAAPADAPAPAGAPASKAATAMTPIGRGISASTEVEATVEASPAFRSFVTNAKISGVFQGTPSRAFINGRLARAGETVDANLGIIFHSVDAERKQLVFKDKSGASVVRKY